MSLTGYSFSAPALLGLLALSAMPACAMLLSGAHTLPPSTASGTIVLAEWQGGKPAKPSKNWDQGGGYGGGQSGNSGT